MEYLKTLKGHYEINWPLNNSFTNEKNYIRSTEKTLAWKKRSICGCRFTMGSLTGSTSLKQMIVTAAQAIMRHTLTMKKKWRNLSRNEHSGNLQWEIWKRDKYMSTFLRGQLRNFGVSMSSSSLLFSTTSQWRSSSGRYKSLWKSNEH